MSRLTNDILTQSMVDSEIKNFISAAKINSATIEYTNIKATVVIEDGNLKEFKYSYDGNVAELNIKVSFISVSGKLKFYTSTIFICFFHTLNKAFLRNPSILRFEVPFCSGHCFLCHCIKIIFCNLNVFKAYWQSHT